MTQETAPNMLGRPVHQYSTGSEMRCPRITRRELLGGALLLTSPRNAESRPARSRETDIVWKNDTKTQIGLNCLQPFGFGFPFHNGGTDDEVMPGERLRRLKGLGFDFLRMAVDPEPLLAADDHQNQELDERIRQIINGVKRRIECDLKIILDIHFHGNLVSHATQWQYSSVLRDNNKAKRFSFVLNRLCRQIASNPVTCSPQNLAFEIFNEPPGPDEVPTWLYKKRLHLWWEAARRAMPEHTIIVGGNSFNDIESSGGGLTALSAEEFDYNTGFAFHMYKSPLFTHQGVPGSLFFVIDKIKFPANANGDEANLKKILSIVVDRNKIPQRHILSDEGWASVHRYYADFGSKDTLRKHIYKAMEWAQKNKLTSRHVFNTEFGVNFSDAVGSDIDSAENYIRSIRDICVEYQINCIVIHEMQGSGFGIQSKEYPWVINDKILAALFK